MLWFVKKKINKHKLLNKRYYKRENFIVDEEEVWDWDYYDFEIF